MGRRFNFAESLQPLRKGSQGKKGVGGRGGGERGEEREGGKTVFRIRIQLNPDPAKNFNPDPEDLESGSGSKLFLNTI